MFPKLGKWQEANKVLQNDASTRDKSKPPADLSSSSSGNEIQSLWLEELKRRGNERASLARVILRTLKTDIIYQILIYIVCRILAPLTLVESTNSLLIYLEHVDLAKFENNSSTSANRVDGFPNQTFLSPLVVLESIMAIDPTVFQCLSIFSIMVIIRMWSFSWITFGGTRIGLKCRTKLTMLIQLKSMRLNLHEQQTGSEAMKLITNEVTFIEEACRYITFAFAGLLTLVVSFAWLAIRVVGWEASMAALPLAIIIIVLKCYLLKVRKKVNARRRVETNKRIQATGAFLDSIKVIKMYAWERPFRDRIQAFRNSELKYSSTLDFLNVMDLVIFASASRLLPSISLLVVIYYRTHFTIQALFLVPLCFQTFCSDYALQFSRGIQSLQDLMTGCARIKKYLLLGEKNDQRQFYLSCVDGKQKQQQQQTPLLICEDLHVSNKPIESKEVNGKNVISGERKEKRETGCFIIRNLSAKLMPGEFVMVVGRVGSGKSTLLRTLLGETRIASGSLQLRQGVSFAYASQEPWIVSDTFRANILFGRPFQARRYATVIEACSLRSDIERLSEADETLIGPRGVSLSGGQKARLNLARAVYTEADVYLLDDPLSAVDTRVAAQIVDRCIKRLLGDKLVVLATHQLQFLGEAGKVIHLEPGKRTEFVQVEQLLRDESIGKLASSLNKNCDFSESDRPPKLSEDRQVKGISEKSGRSSEARSGIDEQNSSNSSDNKSSSYVFFFNLGFNRLSLAFLVLNATLNGPLLLYASYYYRNWSRRAFADMHDEDISGTQFITDLYRSWSIQTSIVALALAHLMIYATHLAKGVRNCSRMLHNRLITSLFHAKMSFYDFCNAGEFTSRYAASFAVIDHQLLYATMHYLSYLIWIIGSCIMLGMITLYGAFHMIGFYLLLSPLTKFFIRRVHLLNGLSKSLLAPTLTNLANMMEDLSTIRSNQSYLNHFQFKFAISQDKYTSMSLLKLSYQTLAFIILRTLIGLMSFALLIIIFSVFRAEMDVSTAGCYLLMLGYVTVLLTAADEYGSAMQEAMGSVDKVRQYTELEPEDGSSSCPGAEVTTKIANNIRWSKGNITFTSVTLRYFANERPVLDSLSFSIAGGERVGIVGRTGAGKSSIISVLFRLYSYEGKISIDGRDIKSVALDGLRSSLGVIPQDPVLFCDTLRNNLDPFGLYSDEQIWHALQVVNLSKHVANNLPARLDHLIIEGGRNFSVGQRQLVCLARAILKSSKILLIDEATANVDLETDAIIQVLIRKQFAESTVITIAHRLETVLDCDRIMVLEGGRIAEFDTVERLRGNQAGMFSQMLAASGAAKTISPSPLSLTEQDQQRHDT